MLSLCRRFLIMYVLTHSLTNTLNGSAAINICCLYVATYLLSYLYVVFFGWNELKFEIFMQLPFASLKIMSPTCSSFCVSLLISKRYFDGELQVHYYTRLIKSLYCGRSLIIRRIRERNTHWNQHLIITVQHLIRKLKLKYLMKQKRCFL